MRFTYYCFAKGNKEINEILMLLHEKCILGEIISDNIMALRVLVTRSAGITQPKPTKTLNRELDTRMGSLKTFSQVREKSLFAYIEHPHPVGFGKCQSRRVEELTLESRKKKLIPLP